MPPLPPTPHSKTNHSPHKVFLESIVLFDMVGIMVFAGHQEQPNFLSLHLIKEFT
ncbi:MAG: hypothetical protein DSM106950_01610 [Stigonema ocellatum SAG 48.90 = DSM 106950]|nr:hypothetical protein [Stigonema ocellatum SAG 48.90 = DSM 106950]